MPELGKPIARLWAAAAVAALLGAVTFFWPGLEVLNHSLKVVAYSVALGYWMKIAGDHPQRSTMRVAWLLLAWSSGISIARHAFELAIHFGNWPLSISSFRQIPTVLALVMLTGGLFAIWFGFAAIGLGSRFRTSDAIWIAAVVAFVPYLFSLRENMVDAKSPYVLIRQLQSLSPVLLAAPALIALLLHRIEQDMRGGQLANSLRLVVAYLVLRLVAMLIMISPGLMNLALPRMIAGAAGWGAIWLFTLAAAYRWRLTLSARELIRRYQADPETELAGLSQMLLAGTSEEATLK
ncbi:MAG TPA: hypothetical protein VKR43_23215 [Bryobacteraceae bacterium]|nr:hypothetical protein [Bryobacteraceae bacterium]